MNVFLTHYSNRHGDDFAIFDSAEKAEKLRQATAAEWWEHEMGEEERPSDPEKMADAYFERMAEDMHSPEYFSVHEMEIQ